MCQVLFWIPLNSLTNGWFSDLPIYGFGTMLFLAFVLCVWVAARLAKRDGVPSERIQDLAIWLFVFGLLGARILYFFLPDSHLSFWQFFAIWTGGLVYYGSLVGGTIGFLLAHRIFLRKYGITRYKLADIIAPSMALGLCIGRIGCLLNGCCYGNVACPHCPAIDFPLSSPPRSAFVMRGVQTVAGFTMETNGNTKVGAVEPGSQAEKAGLRPGDVIIKVNDKEADSAVDLYQALFTLWKPGRDDLSLTVMRGQEEVHIPAIAPRTVGLHPTQVYETISMALLFLVLLAFYPLKRPEGSAFILFMDAYALHRFLNEMLRTDTEKVAFGMTLSQNISILMVVVAAVMSLWVFRPKPRAATAITLTPHAAG